MSTVVPTGYAVLQVLYDDGGTPSEVAARLRERHRVYADVADSTVYAALGVLRRDGLVDELPGPPRAGAGRPVKSFAINDAGRAAADGHVEEVAAVFGSRLRVVVERRG